MSGGRCRVAVYTGNRAEYGLQVPILRAIAAHPGLEYFLLVSGAHFQGGLERSLKEIENDGFRVHVQIAVDKPEDSLYATAQAIGSGTINMSHTLAELQPDVLIVYGDRYEAFSAMIAATQMGIPVAHIEGGDYTEGGALDDSVRHAMTKLAHIHYTTNAQAAERVRQMGEEPWRMLDIGFPALDLIASGDFASPDEVVEKYGLDWERPILLFTQHSVTTEFDQAADQIRPSLEAIAEAGRRWECQTILTYPNDDAGGLRIIRELEAFVADGPEGIQLHRSLGRWNYHGVLNIAAACLGNSSSGIKETKAFDCPCINIGSRQQGRLRAENVIDVDYDKSGILAAIDRCLHDNAFADRVRACDNPYGAGNAGPRIAESLATIELGPKLVQKKMTY